MLMDEFAGGDVCIINKAGMQDDVEGIDSHQIKDIPIVTGFGGFHTIYIYTYI